MEGFRERLREADENAGIFSDIPPGWDDIVPANVKIGRNEPCPCGSGKKYKKCCLNPRSILCGISHKIILCPKSDIDILCDMKHKMKP